jgi:3-oxoacyl-[acyl-carrier protein] reductase
VVVMTTTAIVTGGSAGIGRAVALRLSAEGMNVVVGYHTGRHRAEQVVREITDRGGRAVAVRADVSRRTEVTALFDRTEEAFGGVDAVVNNAGASAVATIESTDDELTDHLLGVNLLGALYGMREAAARLRGGGGIVNLSTTALAGATPGLGVYQAAKAGVEALTRVLAKELGPRGIRVNAVAPGLVDSPMFREGKTAEDVARFTAASPLRRLGTFEEIAATVAYLLSPDATWINGQILRTNGGAA